MKEVGEFKVLLGKILSSSSQSWERQEHCSHGRGTESGGQASEERVEVLPFISSDPTGMGGVAGRVLL